jgi:hypothetical protein
MRKRRVIILAAAVVSVLGLIWWAVASRPPRPVDLVYDGHPLSYWVWTNVPPGDVGLDSNAVPFLAYSLKSNTRLRKAYARLWPHLPAWLRPRLPIPMDPALVRVSCCILLASLGAKARPAIPELIRVLRVDDVNVNRAWAAMALGKIARRGDHDALEALVWATKDPVIGAVAREALRMADPEAADKAGVTNAGLGTSPP